MDHVDLAGSKSEEFDVGHIDISSTYLLDILSDHTVQPTDARGGPSAPKVVADQVATLPLTPMDDADALEQIYLQISVKKPWVDLSPGRSSGVNQSGSYGKPDTWAFA
ncbi:hypothetical protein BDR03DRAFT_1014467 [Suillus americanus]|nr:hypothetical protein BDR03DRAFT_1014467 [Suillus americanus]